MDPHNHTSIGFIKRESTLPMTRNIDQVTGRYATREFGYEEREEYVYQH